MNRFRIGFKIFINIDQDSGKFFHIIISNDISISVRSA